MGGLPLSRFSHYYPVCGFIFAFGPNVNKGVSHRFETFILDQTIVENGDVALDMLSVLVFGYLIME